MNFLKLISIDQFIIDIYKKILIICQFSKLKVKYKFFNIHLSYLSRNRRLLKPI